MLIRDNSGKIVGEINTLIKEGKVITTNTVFYNERPVSQTIQTSESNGKTHSETILGGKLLP